MKSILAILLLLSFSVPLRAIEPPAVPGNLEFCEMEISLTPGGQKKVQEMVNFLYNSPVWHKKLVERADMYMPFVEDAFSLMDVPDDLKYICILESGMVADAVSSSNAVGFWQFKKITAREMGLIVNDQIDERKHIFRSSVAAAKYFHYLNSEFDNWIYSIIGYNQGRSGALPYTKFSKFGAEKLTLDEHTHRYALKAIAHKIAFEDILGKNSRPTLWLEPKNAGKTTFVRNLALENGVEVDAFLEHNKWILKYSLPEHIPFTIYIPHRNEPYLAGMLSDPNRQFYTSNQAPETRVSSVCPKSIRQAAVRRGIYVYSSGDARINSQNTISIREHERYGEDFVLTGPNQVLVEIAVKYNRNINKLVRDNPIDQFTLLQPNTILYLKKRKRAKVYVVEKKATVKEIAAKLNVKSRKLVRKNNFSSAEQELKAGRIIRIRGSGQKGRLLYASELIQPENNATPSTASLVSPPGEDEGGGPSPREIIPDAHPLSEDIPDGYFKLPEPVNYRTEWISYTVKEGESIWDIGRKTGMSPSLIRFGNNIENEDVRKGLSLNILQKVPN